jgi:outer membrane protein assembly factor BamD (BamD/ComL family)
MFRRSLLVLPLATLLAAAAAPKPAAIPAYREGQDALSARLWETAAARFETALTTPELPPASRQTILLRLAEARIRGGDPAAALRVLADPILAPHPELPFWTAQALAADGRFTEALALLGEAATAPAAPHSREARFTRAALLRTLGDLPGALDSLAGLTKDRDLPSSLRARLESAAILLDLGKPDEALTSIPPPNAKMSAPQSARAEVLRARAHLEKGEYPAAVALFTALLEKDDPAARRHQSEAAVGLARARIAAGNREAATDALLAFIEQQRTSPRVGRAFPLLLDCLPAQPTADDVILTRLREWCPPPLPKTPIGIATGNGSTAVWPSALPPADELATQALYHLALGLRREGSAESKGLARQQLARLRLEYPTHPLARRSLLETSRWDLADGRKEQAAAALAALDGSGSAPALRAEASLSAAATAFAAGDFPLAASELDKAGALLDGEARREVALNRAITRLAMGDLPGFQSLAAAQAEDGRVAAELALEQALFQTARRDPGAVAALDRFLLDHPDHPRSAEARLAAAHAALEALPPDPAFAKAQLDALSSAEAAALPPAPLALARIRLAAREERHADAAALAETFLRDHPADPRLPEIRFELGQARFDNGDFNQARLEFEKLATSTPDDPLAPPALLLAARASVLVATPGAKEESVLLFDQLIAAEGPLADVARLEKSRVLAYPDAARELLPWFRAMKKDHPLRLIAGLHLCDALYNSAGTDDAPLQQALGIYEELLGTLPDDSPRRFEIEYYRGRVLEQLPDPKAPSTKRGKEALDVYFSVLQAAARQAPGDWQWVDKCGVRARGLLENTARWDAAIAIAEQHAKLASPGAKEAAERAQALKLEHFIWDESE